ncbi:MAG: ElyC/SanA/YdcF family protein [Firmicutes bacterium]|nr:ElyC/SanA/YdcF family protein [Bacillota bacterium]
MNSGKKCGKSAKKKSKMVLILFMDLLILGAAAVFGIDAYVRSSTEKKIITPGEAAALDDVDCVLVLGCKVNDDGSPSDMLYDRIRRSVELYRAGAAPKLLMSGDRSGQNYDEVGTMKRCAVEAGAASADVFTDAAGYSTYESVYRAKNVFLAEKIIIVTQEYHLHRALYIAEALGVEAYGVSSDFRVYNGQTWRDLREILARDKDFAMAVIKPVPDGSNKTIPISGDGDIANT